MVEGVAPSSGPMRVMRSAGSPISSPPRCPAMSPSGKAGVPAGSNSLAALRVEGLDDLVGDVGARSGEHRFLQDQVVLLGFEDLLDDAVGALDDLRQLLVLALVQVFLE